MHNIYSNYIGLYMYLKCLILVSLGKYFKGNMENMDS